MEIKDEDMHRIDRRGFLTLSAGLVAALAFGSLPGTGWAGQTQFAEGRCAGGDAAGKRVLIAYASKHGSTGGVADAIGKELCGKGLAADVALIRNARDLGSYQGIVVGSAIYMGKWMSEAADFVKQNRDVLSRVPVAYFLVCITMVQPDEKKRAEALSYMNPILQAAPEVKPVGLATFAGALDYSKLSWLNRKILKAKGAPEGDFRDWNTIRAWAREPVYARLAR